MNQAVNVLRLVTERLGARLSVADQLVQRVSLHRFVCQLIHGLVFGTRDPVCLFQHFRFEGDVLLQRGMGNVLETL
ncbi:MAG TPA: hypothetical protein VE422_26585 [Terriglobia bacterium]|nr:hypothetical protein [Terriglobia bacterium]